MSKKSRKELKDQVLELSYTVEALDDEIEFLHNTINDLRTQNSEKQQRIVELINENDRLTITYEPWRPEDDPHFDVDFYSLIEDNDALTQNVLDKIAVIEELDERIQKLVNENYDLRRTLQVNASVINKAAKKPLIKNERWWNFSFELWPGAWGLNYYRYDWQRAQRSGHPGEAREGQIQVGPFGFSWNREPKR